MLKNKIFCLKKTLCNSLSESSIPYQLMSWYRTAWNLIFVEMCDIYCVAKVLHVLHFCSVCKPRSLKRLTPLKQHQCVGRCCFLSLITFSHKNIISQTTCAASHTMFFFFIFSLQRSSVKIRDTPVTWIRLGVGLETCVRRTGESAVESRDGQIILRGSLHNQM